MPRHLCTSLQRLVRLCAEGTFRVPVRLPCSLTQHKTSPTHSVRILCASRDFRMQIRSFLAALPVQIVPATSLTMLLAAAD